MFIVESCNKHGANVFCSFERTHIIQITNVTFFYNRFSTSTDNFLKSMGRFRIPLLHEDNTWSTQYTIPKNRQYSNTSTDWTFLNLCFTVEHYGFKLIHDEIDKPHADMCFISITITHPVY